MLKLKKIPHLFFVMGTLSPHSFLFAAAAAVPSQTKGSGAVQFETPSGPPPGFSDADLNVTETNYISVYYGNNFLGNILGTYTNNTINLGDISSLVQSIPGILDPAAVTAALKGSISTNSSALCSGAASNTQAYCNVITPDVAGVIFDPNTYRATIFINPKYLSAEAINSARPTIPNSTAGFSYIANNNFSVASSTGTQTYSLNNLSMFGKGNNSVNITSNITENIQTGSPSTSVYTLQNANVTRLSNGKYYQVGMLTPLTGGGFLGAPTILGASIQNYGILPSTAQGNPIVVFLPLPSQVAIYKNGFLISTQSFNAGKQNIDTSSFPDGSYDITLKITNNAGQVTTQTQFFSKQNALPPQGSPNYQVSAGVLQSNATAGTSSGNIITPTFASVPLFTYSEMRKIGVDYGLQSVIMTTFNRAYLTETLNYYGIDWQISPGVLVSNNQQYGWLLNLAFTPVSFPNFQFTSNNQKITNSIISNTSSPIVSASTYSPVSATQLQSTNTANWTINEKTEASLSASYNKNPGAGGTLQYGFSLSRTLFSGQTLSVSSSASILKATGQTPILFFQLSSSFNTVSNINVGLGVGYNNSNTITNVGGSSYNVYKPSYTETISKDANWGPNNSSNLAVGANLLQSYTTNSNTVNLAYNSELMAANFNYSRNKSTQYTNPGNGNLQSSSQTVSQLSGNILNNIAITSRGVGFGYAGGGNSAIMTKVYAPAPVKSDVFINGQNYGTVNSNSSKAFFLSPYQTYQVTIQPIGAAEYGFDTRSQNVTIYNGNVANTTWTLSKQYVLFAQIVDTQAKPLDNILMISKNPGDFNTTDQNGYIQANVLENTTAIDFKDINGNTCEVKLNADEIKKEDQNGLVVLNTPLVCQPLPDSDNKT